MKKKTFISNAKILKVHITIFQFFQSFQLTINAILLDKNPVC